MAAPNPTGYCECGCGERTRLAPCSNHSRNMVRGEPMRFVRGHYQRMPKLGTESPIYQEEDRGFFSACHIWQGKKNKNGYGSILVEGIQRVAHRHVYETEFGPLVDGQELHHLCGVRSCINCEHLLPMEIPEHRSLSAGQGFTQPTVKRIRAIAETGLLSHAEIARAFRVTRSNITYIVNGKTWKEAR